MNQIVLPELFAELGLGHRRLELRQTAAIIEKGVHDVAHRKATRQHLGRQALQGFYLSLQMLTDLGTLGLLQASNLRAE